MPNKNNSYKSTINLKGNMYLIKNVNNIFYNIILFLQKFDFFNKMANSLNSILQANSDIFFNIKNNINNNFIEQRNPNDGNSLNERPEESVNIHIEDNNILDSKNLEVISEESIILKEKETEKNFDDYIKFASGKANKTYITRKGL